jgi:diguanylate cyclase (GGDEF)-like protein
VEVGAVALERGLLLRRPGAVIGVVLLLISLDALLWSVFGPAGTPVVPDRFASLLLAALGVLCLLVPPARPRWILEAAAASAVVIMMSAVATRVTPQGVLSVGVALLMLLVAAATFVPTRRLALGIATGLAALAVGVLVNPVHVGALYIWFLATAIVVVPWVVSALMTELRGLVEVSAEAALHDPLTGVSNRRGVVEEADRVRAVTERAGTPTALAAIDLDGFKTVNDSRGHAAGDGVLIALTRAWGSALRAGDVLGRIGGDEFLVVLPNTDARGAAATVERMRGVHPFPWSCGVVDWDPDEDLDAAMARADVLLYEDKARRAAATIDLRGTAERMSHGD